MSRLHSSGIPFCLVVLAIVVSGCAATNGGRTQPQPDAQSWPHIETSPHSPGQVSSKAPAQTTASKQAPPPPQERVPPSPRQLVEAGEYQKALEEYGARHRKHPGDQALVTEYVKSIEEMKSAADRAYEAEQFATAGRIYDMLLKRHAQFKDFARLLTFNTGYLNQKLSLCKKSLALRGFQEYRKGDLDEAIAAWRGLLTIDPNNEDIKKAVNTATEQQKNFQKRK